MDANVRIYNDSLTEGAESDERASIMLRNRAISCVTALDEQSHGLYRIVLWDWYRIGGEPEKLKGQYGLNHQ